MKKLMSVILSLTIAVCAFSSCAQKEPVEEVSVETVSAPDNLNADDNDGAQDNQDGDDENTDEQSESNTSKDESSDAEDSASDTSGSESETDTSTSVEENDTEDTSQSQNDDSDSGSDTDTSQSQIDNSGNSTDTSQSQNDGSNSSTDTDTSQSQSGNSNGTTDEESDNSRPTVTTAVGNGNSNTVTTTSKSGSSSSGGTTTTKAQTTKTTTTAKVTTTAKTTTKTTTTTPTAVTVAPSEVVYPEGAVIINLSGTPECDSSDVTITSDKISITAGGIYYLIGSFDGQIYIKTGEGNTGEADVDLYLGGVDIECSYGPAIFCDNAKRLEIHVEDGTSNVIKDGGSDAISNGAIFANDTIEIRGKGTLSVYGNNREGIASDDDIFIENGNIYIYSVDDGMNANDCITINGGYTYIEATGDGIDSKGTTVMNDGTVIIAKTGAAESAVESDSTYTLNGGTFIAVGGTGVIKTPTTSSTQAIVALDIQDFAAGDIIAIKVSDGKTIALCPTAAYSTFIFTCPELAEGGQYEVYFDCVLSTSALTDNVSYNAGIATYSYSHTATAQ